MDAPWRVVDATTPIPISIILKDCDEDDVREVLLRFASEWRHVATVIDGHELRRRGVPPGPVYRDLLQSLKDAWLDGLIATPAEEEDLLQSLLENHGQN